MKTKKQQNLKRQAALSEYSELLNTLESVNELLDGDSKKVNLIALISKVRDLTSFNKLTNWITSTLKREMPNAPKRTKQLVSSLDKEFPWVDESDLSQASASRVVQRMFAVNISRHFLDTSIILHVTGWNGPAIIELHSVLERAALEKLIEIVFKEDKRELGEKILGRKFLPELASLLFDCNVIGKEDLQFAQELNKLRNGLGHKNSKLISNVAFSGKELSLGDIDWVMSNVDYAQYIINAIHLMAKLISSDDDVLIKALSTPSAG